MISLRRKPYERKSRVRWERHVEKANSWWWRGDAASKGLPSGVTDHGGI